MCSGKVIEESMRGIISFMIWCNEVEIEKWVLHHYIKTDYKIIRSNLAYSLERKIAFLLYFMFRFAGDLFIYELDLSQAYFMR